MSHVSHEWVVSHMHASCHITHEWVTSCVRIQETKRQSTNSMCTHLLAGLFWTCRYFWHVCVAAVRGSWLCSHVVPMLMYVTCKRRQRKGEREKEGVGETEIHNDIETDRERESARARRRVGERTKREREREREREWQAAKERERARERKSARKRESDGERGRERERERERESARERETERDRERERECACVRVRVWLIHMQQRFYLTQLCRHVLMNVSCVWYVCVMSHVWIRNITQIKKSFHTCCGTWAMTRPWLCFPIWRHYACNIEMKSRVTYAWVMPHI